MNDEMLALLLELVGCKDWRLFVDPTRMFHTSILRVRGLSKPRIQMLQEFITGTIPSACSITVIPDSDGIASPSNPPAVHLLDGHYSTGKPVPLCRYSADHDTISDMWGAVSCRECKEIKYRKQFEPPKRINRTPGKKRKKTDLLPPEHRPPSKVGKERDLATDLFGAPVLPEHRDSFECTALALMEQSDPRAAFIACVYYGFFDGTPRHLKTAGAMVRSANSTEKKQYGLSTTRARGLLDRALRRLRHPSRMRHLNRFSPKQVDQAA